MIEVPNSKFEIDLIVQLLSKVQIVRQSDPIEYIKCVFLAKRGLDLLADELIEQVKKETQVITNQSITN